MASSTPPNNDVVTEILSHLPVQCLLRFRAVCKFWRDVIDSPSFRKLHTHINNNDNNNGDDTVYLQFTFLGDGERKLSIKLLHNMKWLKSYSDKLNNELSTFLELINQEYDKSYNHHFIRLVGPVKGLVCIYSTCRMELPIALCIPFLGQLKILPNTNSCGICRRDVAIGFDGGEDYKVVHLVKCCEDLRLRAQLYSAKANSWRELVLDDNTQYIHIFKPIKSLSSRNAHWEGFRTGRGISESIILSFDMENEVFRTIIMPDVRSLDKGNTDEILAEDKDSFLLFVLLPYDVNGVSETMIYESRFEGSKLSWNRLMNVEEPYHGISLWMRSHCVVFKTNCIGLGKFLKRKELIVYDYGARKLITRFELHKRSEVIEYKGSFVSILSQRV